MIILFDIVNISSERRPRTVGKSVDCFWFTCDTKPLTGSEKRLERIKKFANREAYAFEELVAEIGACFLGAQIGVAPEFGQSAAYVEGWLR